MPGHDDEEHGAVSVGSDDDYLYGDGDNVGGILGLFLFWQDFQNF
jgi:hypothetical protein